MEKDSYKKFFCVHFIVKYVPSTSLWCTSFGLVNVRNVGVDAFNAVHYALQAGVVLADV